MADGSVGVLQAAEPDRLIDNETYTISGTTVYRQRVVSYQPLEEHRFDYDGRLDGNAVYIGSATPGSATSAAVWTVLKFTYDATNRPTRKQVQTNIAYDNRATGW